MSAFPQADPLHDHDHGHDDRWERAQSWIKAALLSGLSLYFLYNILSGSLTNYINERFAWLSWVAVLLFAILGAGALWEALRGGHAHHNHDHSHAVSWPVLGIIAVPLVLGTLVPSRPLGSAAIDGSISLTAASVTTATTFTTDPLKWNILDWLRTFNATDDLSTLNGRQANVIGFVYTEPTFPENMLMVARFTVSCCVADASAIGLPVYWEGAADLKADTWIQVEGTFEVGAFRNDTVPILKASRVQVVEQPEHPYLYP